jgi:hypothetical protein
MEDKIMAIMYITGTIAEEPRLFDHRRKDKYGEYYETRGMKFKVKDDSQNVHFFMTYFDVPDAIVDEAQEGDTYKFKAFVVRQHNDRTNEWNWEFHIREMTKVYPASSKKPVGTKPREAFPKPSAWF